MFEDQRQSLAKEINSGKALTSEIFKVTTGIFQRGENKNVAKVLDITEENINDFAIGVVKEGKDGVGPISYIDSNGDVVTTADNISLGTTVIINKKTGEWVPLEHEMQDTNSIDQILGIIQYTINYAKQNRIGILDAAKRRIKYGKDKFQMFATSSKAFASEDAIPLFPVYKASKKTRKGTENYSSRWSAMTTLINWGYDSKNARNSIYFFKDGTLQYYSFEQNRLNRISMNKLSELLDKYLDGKIDEMTEDEFFLMGDLINTLKQKYKNISVQYALNTTNAKGNMAFLKPAYDAKNKEVTFKYYKSYMHYVLGFGGTPSIVSTKAAKIDGRTSFQKSIILEHNADKTGIILNQENSIATTTRDSKTKKEPTKKVEKKEVVKEKIPTQDTSTFEPFDYTLNKDQEVIYYSDGKVLYASEEAGEYVYDGIVLTREDVDKNENAKNLFNKIKENASKISKLSDGFEKEMLRDRNRILYHNLIRILKNINLTNSKEYDNQIKEKEEYNKDKDAKLIPGAVINIEGDGGYTITEFLYTVAGSTGILTSIDGKTKKSMSTNVLLMGLKEGKIKIADNQEVGTKKEVVKSKLNELKNLIAKTEDLTSIMDDIFKVLDENKYIEWQNKFDKEQIEKDLKTQLESAKSENEVANILTKYLLPKFIDAELTALQPTTVSDIESKTKEELFPIGSLHKGKESGDTLKVIGYTKDGVRFEIQTEGKLKPTKNLILSELKRLIKEGKLTSDVYTELDALEGAKPTKKAKPVATEIVSAKAQFEQLQKLVDGFAEGQTYESFSQQSMLEDEMTQDEVDNYISNKFQNIAPLYQNDLTTEKIVKDNNITRDCE